MTDIKFLKLHNADDNSIVVVPVNEIIYAYLVRDSDGTYTEINLKSYEDDYVAVNESPEKLYNMLKSEGFVRCHRKTDNSTVIFNIQYLYLVIKSADGEVLIKMQQDADVSVNESSERIFNAIIEAKNNMLNKENNIAAKKENIPVSEIKEEKS